VRKAQTSGAGDFELDNIPPGDYKLSLDTSSLPANYVAPSDAIAVHVSPVSTSVANVPMRALRSISGRVMLREPKESAPETRSSLADTHESKAGYSQKKNDPKAQADPGSKGAEEEFVFIPLPDVQISADKVVVKTDQEGNFLFRNLPAGKLAISLVPVKPMPDGMKLPSGQVDLPADPIQVQGASIVISNPELVPYLTTVPLNNRPGVAPGKAAPILQGKTSPAPASQPAVTPTAGLHSQAAQSMADRKAVPSAPTPTDAPAGSSVPNTVPIAALPASILRGKLARVPVASPSAPLVAVAQTPVAVAQEGLAKYTDCAHMPTLGEIAHCYALTKKR